ncbi:MAG: MmcQ/YjbR family DNA-binding protein [Acidobacteria bacterium]|nr:MmcQ/YjbR family DNA-binding protein [Acidobacteriota bacterium]
MKPEDFRRIALSFEGAVEGSPMGAVDFRVNGRIFATLASVKEGYGNLMLTPELQSEFVENAPDLFLPIHGGWGRMGMTHIVLKAANRDMLTGALEAAWRLKAAKKRSPSRKPAESPSSATPRPAKKSKARKSDPSQG